MKLADFNNLFRLSHLSFFTLITVGVLVIPFIFSSSTIDPVLLPRFVALSVLTFVLILMVSIQASKSRRSIDLGIVYRVITPVITCYLIISVLSLSKAINLTEGIFECLKIFLSFAFLYVATLIIGEKKESVLVLAKSVIVTAMILSIIGICQYYQLAFTSIPGNCLAYSTMANKNLFASALFLTLPFVLFGAFQFAGCWRILSLASFALISFCIAVTETRTVWGAMAFSGIITTLLAVECHRRFKASDARGCLSAKRSLHVLVVLVCMISLARLSNHSYARKISRAAPPSHHHSQDLISPSRTSILSFNSLNERLLLWDKSLNMIEDNPLTGVGLGQWKLVLPHYGKIEKLIVSDEGLNEVLFQRPHNDYLWVLAEVGLLGFVCYLSFFLILICYTIRIIFKSEERDSRVFSMLILFGILGYMVLAFFTFPKERIFHNILLMLITACVFSLYNQTFPVHKKVTGSQITALNIPLLMLLTSCVIFGSARLHSEIHTRSALSARKAKKWKQVIAEIDKADSWFYNMDPVSTPLSWYRGMAHFSLGHISLAFEDFKKAHKIHPNHTHVLNNLGTCYALLKNYERAAEYYQRVLDISPGFEEALFNLSVVYYHMGKYKEAYNTLLLCEQNGNPGKISKYLKIIENRLKVDSNNSSLAHSSVVF